MGGNGPFKRLGIFWIMLSNKGSVPRIKSAIPPLFVVVRSGYKPYANNKTNVIAVVLVWVAIIDPASWVLALMVCRYVPYVKDETTSRFSLDYRFHSCRDMLLRRPRRQCFHCFFGMQTSSFFIPIPPEALNVDVILFIAK